MNISQLGELKKDLPEMRAGDTVRVYEKVAGEQKKKSQVFEGILISKKHGKGINATFTLRAILEGLGVEKTYPLHSPLIEKIEVVKKGKAKRAKLYYLRNETEKKIRKKLKAEVVKADKSR
jgi:large subunit ribosomal protein L19